MAKRFFIKSSNDLIKLELEKLQNKVTFLEASTSEVKPVKRVKRTAIYSPPTPVEATRMGFEFDCDEDTFSTN
jgi:hypothetical protein